MKNAKKNAAKLGLTRQREVVLQVICDAEEHFEHPSIHDSMDTWAHRTSVQSLRIKPVEESVDSVMAGAYVVGAAI